MTMAAGWMKGFVVCLILKLAVSQLSAEVPEQQPVQVPVQEPLSVLDLQQSNDLCEEGLESLTVFPETKDCHDICIASGDPHFNTFDCVKYEYHGRCSYTLAKNCGGDLEDFEIIGEFHRMKYHRVLSIIKSLLITVSGTNIKMDAKFNVFINSDRVTTAATTVSFAHIQRYCNAVVVTLTNGITIYWSSPYRAMIKINSDVDATLAGNLCGLCGNNNDIKFDDLTARNKSLVSDVVVLGDSWRTNGKCGLCNDCENNLCENNPQNSKIAQTFCESFFLQDQIVACGDKDPKEWYNKCVNILCAALPETDGFCHIVNLYMDVCEGAGIQVQIELPKPCYGGFLCREGLGMENKLISDDQISASTMWDVNHGPGNARLNRPAQGSTTGGWSAKRNDLNQWIQADLGDLQLASGVVTQGRNGYAQWVTKYNVQYSEDGESWSFVQDNGANVEFHGNSDTDTPVTNMFASQLRARFIRIRPTAWHGHISMRFEVLGCEV